MNDNPFRNTQLLNLPLELDICHQVHYAALRVAAAGLNSEMIPKGFSLEERRKLARYWGNDVYLLHPVDIERAFSGVTLAVYQKITELYCNRLERNIWIVHQIINKMAEEVGATALSYEATWAICLYLEDPHRDNTEVTTFQTGNEWRLIEFRPSITTYNRDGQLFSPVLLGIIDSLSSKVLAFRFCQEAEASETAALVIYDALILQREPSPDGATGLIWPLPAAISTVIKLPRHLEQVLQRLGITARVSSSETGLPGLLENWGSSLVGKVLDQQDAIKRFDMFLHQAFGYAPVRMQRSLTYKLSNLTGYGQDPAWQFPALRQLLPERESVISENGQVEYDGLHYEHPLLNYWSGRQVTLRRSEYAEATAWIYLENNVLCLAVARELRRKDGSYRLNRPGKG